jgi:hypothetical protein
MKQDEFDLDVAMKNANNYSGFPVRHQGSDLLQQALDSALDKK